MYHRESDRSAYPALPSILAIAGIVVLLVALYVMDASAEQNSATASGMIDTTSAASIF